MSLEDFMQMGRTKVFELIKEYDSSKGVPFLTFIYKPLGNMFIKWIQAATAEKRDLSKVISYNNCDSNGDELLDYYIDHRTNVERFVVNKIFAEQILSLKCLSSQQKKVLRYRIQGLTNDEIAKKMNAGFRSVSQSYYLAVNKIRSVAI